MYDILAPHYRDYAAAKAAYLDAVDRLVIERIPSGAASMLDVGAGDGSRSVRIAKARGIGTLVLAEPCKEMLAQGQGLDCAEMWSVAAEDLPETERRFDVITCLWNVLGHVPTYDRRVQALRKMGRLLTEQGRLFLDVNNRHNSRAYGIWRVIGRVAYDAVFPVNSKGDAVYTVRIGEKEVIAMGHLFHPGEMRGLFVAAGLDVCRRWAIDYRTGQRCMAPWKGQLVYELGRGGSA
jgi:SAM-dependent methyltransferase